MQPHLEDFMVTMASRRQSAAVLLVVLVLCAAASLSDLREGSYLALSAQTDFQVYDIASMLVRHHQSNMLYQDAGTGVDPQLRDASSGSALLRQARQQGLSKTQLYVYPPFWADALLPVSGLPLSTADLLWRLFNLSAAFAGAYGVSRLLDLKLWSAPAALLIATLFCFSPLWQGIHYGQVTPLLFALWSIALLLYTRGWKSTSAVLMSIAVLIKLTPMLLVMPMLIWKDWRWLFSFSCGLLAGIAIMSAMNSPGVFLFYLSHVVPPMSGGVIERQNQTVGAFIQMEWCQGRPLKGASVPAAVLAFGRLLSVLLVCLAGCLTYRSGRVLSVSQRSRTLASFALLSLCVSPLTWIDSFVIGFILLAILWVQLLRQSAPRIVLVLVSLATAAVGASLGIKHFYSLDRFITLQYAPLLLSVLLSLYVLYRGEQLFTPAHINHEPNISSSL